MAHHSQKRPAPAGRPRHQRIAAIVVALMILTLAIYGYQFWWTE